MILGPDGRPLEPVTKEPAEIRLPGGDEPLTARQAEDAREFYHYAREWMRLARHVERTPPRSRPAARHAQMKLNRYARKCDSIGERLNGLTLQAFLDALKEQNAKETEKTA